ncbi:MAG: LLM class F420-dependent oxidoreductase [Acidimicrobiia bacterium]|nr:LLM class F420-dependent oxidoreductase [Acidimicrobiia bacterium]
MDIGVFIFPTDQTMQPVELGRAVEERGFESLWFPEHSHIPTSRTTPWGGRKDAPPLPEYYWRTHDQFVALSAVAATTNSLKVGTGICLLAQRDPIWTAKEVASLDMISGGRFIFGIGYGWNIEEFEDHGLVFSERRDRIRECVLAMKELWTAEEASYDGEHVSLSPSWSWPKPVQDPHPPIILGGSVGPKTAADIAEFCDGWMPIGASNFTGLDLIEEACEERGRDPKSVHLGVFRARPDAEALDALAEQGAQRALLELPQGPPDEVLAALDAYAPLLDR